MTGANSAVGLRSMPARYLFLDEVDGYPGDVDGEGDPILLAERAPAPSSAARSCWSPRRRSRACRGSSASTRQSDQRRYFVPCPHCHEHQTLEFANLRWPKGRPREAEYACAHCGALIGERHKTWMLEHGEWRRLRRAMAARPGSISPACTARSGWFSWADAAEMYEQAHKTPDLMKGFVNTVLGLPFEEEAEAPDWQRLYERRESLPYRHRARARPVPHRRRRRPEGPDRGRGGRLGPGQGELVGRLPRDRGRQRPARGLGSSWMRCSRGTGRTRPARPCRSG